MKRPTIFLSSTIYDFRDIRSAIKDYLESRGCRVLASDQNDFDKDLNPHSYEACLKAIEQADVFLLLIGSRVGGLVDAKERISITRAEYRRAYELAEEGRIRLLSFVRSDVFNHRESVKGIERFLEEVAVAEFEAKSVVAKAPTKFMTDATAIINFIEEVSRNAETSAAVKGERQFPKANWLHQFASFADIRQQLDILILAGLEVSEAAGRLALRLLLTRQLKDLLILVDGQPMIPSTTVRRLVQEINLRADQIGMKVNIPPKTWSQFVHLIVSMQNSVADPAPLIPVLNSPLLLEYDQATGEFRETPEHKALVELIQRIAAFNAAKAGVNFVRLVTGVVVKKNQPAVAVTAEVAAHLQLLMRWCELADTVAALAKGMTGCQFHMPKPMPRTPFVDQEAGIEAEQVTAEHVEAFLARS